MSCPCFIGVRFASWVKEIYPNSRTENPYENEFEAFAKHMDLDERLLFHDLIHSITLINGHSRINGSNQLISTHGDFMNAVQLMTPKALQLTSKSLDAHATLVSVFQNKTFDYIQAARALKVSIKTIKRFFKSLITHNLVHQLPTKAGKRALFQAIEINVTHEEPSLGMFETMQGEWKDFVGFVEF